VTRQVLPQRSDRASAGFAPPVTELRPFLLILLGDDRSLALTTAIQEGGVPCVLAFDDRMVEYWARAEQPRVAVVDIDSSWTRNISDTLIRRGLAVVALSEDEEARIAALGRGFQDALPSSLAPREVAARLRQRFLPPRLPLFEVQHVDGPLRIDIAQRRAWWWDEEKHLSPMQFDLLAHLVARADTMISIETLLREVWREAWGDRNKVTKMIGRIREALGKDSVAYLRSVPGRYGYLTR
jgi:DNA-binding response OmpR family regulator